MVAENGILSTNALAIPVSYTHLDVYKRQVITQGVFVAAMTIAAYWIGADLSGHQTGQTMAFCVLAFSQMLRAFNQRSNTQPIWVRAEGHNPWLILSFAVSLILMMCLLLIPALQDIFRLTSLSAPVSYTHLEISSS